MRHDEAPTSRPASLPADAIGFISTRRRNDRFAAFRPDGSLMVTWGYDLADAHAALAAGGYTVDDQGIIWAGR